MENDHTNGDTDELDVSNQTLDETLNWKYSEKQQTEIAKALNLPLKANGSPKKSSKEIIRRIGQQVALTSEAFYRQDDQPINDAFKKQYLNLPNHIDQVLDVLENDEFDKGQKELYSGLAVELKVLRKSILNDKPKRGGQVNFENKLKQDLVFFLANNWREITKTKPTHTFDGTKADDDPDRRRSKGPFVDFLHLCCKPANIKLSDRVISEGIKSWKAAPDELGREAWRYTASARDFLEN